jgi:hypothetical protein
MKKTAPNFTRTLLATALLALFSAQALAATTYVYRKNIPGVKESLAHLEARTVPFIDHATPAGGDTAGGNVMAIYATPDGLNPLYGYGFAPGTTVAVDGVPATASLQGVVSPGMAASLNVVMPPHNTGTSTVTVTDPSGRQVTAPYAYTHNVTVSQVSPLTAIIAGTTLAVYGTGFVPGSTVSVDGVGASTGYVSSTQLAAYAPTHAAGTANLTVTNPDTSTFTFSGMSYGSPATATFSTTQLNAGTVSIGQYSLPLTATLSNTGDVPLNYAALSALPAAWSLSTGTGACVTAGGTLAAKSSCTYTFVFTPTDTSQGGGSVTFTPTTAGLSPTTLLLTGSAVPATVTQSTSFESVNPFFTPLSGSVGTWGGAYTGTHNLDQANQYNGTIALEWTLPQGTTSFDFSVYVHPNGYVSTSTVQLLKETSPNVWTVIPTAGYGWPTYGTFPNTWTYLTATTVNATGGTGNFKFYWSIGTAGWIDDVTVSYH